MGLSSAATVLLSVVRAKIVAIELGAPGVGILGIVMTSVALASTALGLGLGASGVRAVAASEDGDGRRSIAQVAVVRGSIALALVAGPLVCLGWWWWGDLLVPDADASELAPWVALSVVAAIGTAGTSALLNGLRRIGALAASTALGSAVGTLVFLLAMQVSDRWGLIAAFAAVPTATVVVGAVMARSTYPRRARVTRRLWAPELARMLVLGLAISSSVILTNASQVVARVWVSHELGLAQAGLVQACMAVGAVYLGSVLTALGAEYYPRISMLREDPDAMNRAANDQVRVVLTLGAPLIVWMIATAPWLLVLLYSAEFQEAHTLLRLLVIGDVFKLVGWCTGFLFMAREARLKFVVVEVSWNAFFLAVLIPLAHHGAWVVGFAYVVAYVLYLIVSLVMARRETAFVLDRAGRRTVLWVCLATFTTFAAVELGSDLGLAAALLVGLVCTVVAVIRVVAWTRLDTAEA
jgi:PST family polysaccharide transporter